MLQTLGEMEQQCWITLTMGSILIDILTWKGGQKMFSNCLPSPPAASRRDLCERSGAFVFCYMNQTQGLKVCLFEGARRDEVIISKVVQGINLLLIV